MACFNFITLLNPSKIIKLQKILKFKGKRNNVILIKKQIDINVWRKQYELRDECHKINTLFIKYVETNIAENLPLLLKINIPRRSEIIYIVLALKKNKLKKKIFKVKDFSGQRKN